MKVVFLDIDGVVAPTGTKRRLPSRQCIEQLNRITAATGAQIVLSTGSRFHPDVEAMLAEWGVHAPIIGRTPLVNNGQANRGQEIAAWLAGCAEPIERFVILDDEPDMGP